MEQLVNDVNSFIYGWLICTILLAIVVGSILAYTQIESHKAYEAQKEQARLAKEMVIREKEEARRRKEIHNRITKETLSKERIYLAKLRQKLREVE